MAFINLAKISKINKFDQPLLMCLKGKENTPLLSEACPSQKNMLITDLAFNIPLLGEYC